MKLFSHDSPMNFYARDMFYSGFELETHEELVMNLIEQKNIKSHEKICIQY